jgi:DNA-binding transcriptional regulator LsrR (DeoR family)
MSETTPQASAADWFDPQLAAKACRLYFLERASKSDIATELGMSRFKVARLIDEAQNRKMVRIEILAPEASLDSLTAEVVETFGLTGARVVPTGNSDALTLRELGAAAAQYAVAELPAGSSLGLGWGRAVSAVVSHLDAEGPVNVVQLAGGFAGPDREFNGTEVVMEAAKRLHGASSLLYAPAVLESAEARAMLWKEPAIRETVDRYDSLDVIITGVGARRPVPTSALYRGSVLNPDVLAELEAEGVIGDSCCHFVKQNGELVKSFEQRIVGVSADQIRKTPLRISVATGAEKVDAILAALRSGLVNALVIDSLTASLVLKAHSEAPAVSPSPSSSDRR